MGEVLSELSKDSFGRIGLGVFSLFLLLALVSPLITGDPMLHSTSVLNPPSSEHMLGTNDVGQDIWSRLIRGVRTSILVAVGVGILTTLIGAIVGVSAGLIGGIYDEVLMRIVDALLAIPAIVVLILIASFLRPTLWTLILLISILHWQGGARIMRAQTLSLKERAYISAARAFGAGGGYLILKHVMPGLGPILISSFIYSARMAVFMEAGLAFIGIADPTTVSWGAMMHHALKFYYLPVWKWWLLPPGAALSLLILSFTFLGYSLERIIEPRLRNA